MLKVPRPHQETASDFSSKQTTVLSKRDCAYDAHELERHSYVPQIIKHGEENEDYPQRTIHGGDAA